MGGDASFAHDQNSRIAQLEQRVKYLEEKLATAIKVMEYISYEEGPINSLSGPHIIFSGVNVHVRNGAGPAPDDTNGLGNLIIGYNTCPEGGDQTENCDEMAVGRGGSHYVVVGDRHQYSQDDGFVAGFANIASGRSASVMGRRNVASGRGASVCGGQGNEASGEAASISGGGYNTASGYGASISGGADNSATGEAASVSGGADNTAGGDLSSVSGGEGNIASGTRASVSGGRENSADHSYSTVSGGYHLVTTADYDHIP